MYNFFIVQNRKKKTSLNEQFRNCTGKLANKSVNQSDTLKQLNGMKQKRKNWYAMNAEQEKERKLEMKGKGRTCQKQYCGIN